MKFDEVALRRENFRFRFPGRTSRATGIIVYRECKATFSLLSPSEEGPRKITPIWAIRVGCGGWVGAADLGGLSSSESHVHKGHGLAQRHALTQMQ